LDNKLKALFDGIFIIPKPSLKEYEKFIQNLIKEVHRE
jgi:hypothetical protein